MRREPTHQYLLPHPTISIIPNEPLAERRRANIRYGNGPLVGLLDVDYLAVVTVVSVESVEFLPVRFSLAIQRQPNALAPNHTIVAA